MWHGHITCVTVGPEHRRLGEQSSLFISYRNPLVQCSVADPGCLSRILIFTHPGSRIPDPRSNNINKDRGENFFFQTIFCSHKFHKTQYYFIFDMLKKKFWPNFPRIIEVFTQKIVTKPSKIWVWDPGSEIRDPRSGIWDPEKTYSRSRIQGSKRHRIPDPDPQH